MSASRQRIHSHASRRSRSIPVRKGAAHRRTAQPLRIEFVPHPLFAEASAAASIEALRPDAADGGQPVSPPCEPDALLHAALFERPPLSRDRERYLFLRMNFARYRADRLQRLDSPRKSRQIAALLQEASGIRNQIAEANQRLVVSVAARFADALTPLDELVSAAQLPLLRAVELFDVSRGYCFSTYATHTIRNHCQRVRSQAARRARQIAAVDPAEVEAAAPGPIAEDAVALQQSLIGGFFDELVDRERVIISARFGLGEYGRPHTFQEIGRLLGLSKERARVLAGRAIDKLRELVRQQNLVWTAP